MAISAKEYYEGVLKQAGVSETKRQALVAALEDEEISKALVNEQIAPRLRHDEFSREMDRLKSEKEKTATYYQQLVTWKQEQDAAFAGAGAGNGAGNGDYLTKKDIEALEKKYQDSLKQQEASFITISKMMGRLASQHAVEFKEALDTDALEKMAIEKQLPLPQAYEAMVGTRRAEIQNQSFAAKLAAAKEEGAREFASKHKLPIDTVAREPEFGRLTFDRPGDKSVAPDYVPNTGQLSPASTRALRDSFVEAYNSAPSNTSGT